MGREFIYASRGLLGREFIYASRGLLCLWNKDSLEVINCSLEMDFIRVEGLWLDLGKF